MPSTRPELAAYVPDRPPTWTEALLVTLLAVNIGVELVFSSQHSWAATGVGFLVFSAVLGPASNTATGNRIGHWFRGLHPAGRTAVIVLFALIVGVSYQIDAVPSTLIADAAIGGLIACTLYLLIYIALAGGVSGWVVDRENDH
jgi:hypothetical protein